MSLWFFLAGNQPQVNPARVTCRSLPYLSNPSLDPYNQTLLDVGRFNRGCPDADLVGVRRTHLGQSENGKVSSPYLLTGIRLVDRGNELRAPGRVER